MRRLLFLFVTAVGFWACVEEPTSPARCPDFCPGTKLAAVESLFPTAISRDSTFLGYVNPVDAGLLPATTEAGVDSRPITHLVKFGFLRVNLDSVDTLTGPIVIDSMKLMVRFLRPDTATRNLRISFYQLPDSIDSTTTLADLAPSFAGAPLRVVSVDSLLSQSSRRDSVMGDTVLTNGTTDTNTTLTQQTQHVVTLRLKFDSAHAPFSPPDSGRLSLGVQITADNKPTVFFGAQGTGLGLLATWFYRVDSAGKLIRPDSIFYKCAKGSSINPCPQHPQDSIQTGTDFDTFVYTAPALPPDSNLEIGGVPSRRALLRIGFPKNIRDSSQVLRAQLFLIPTATAPLDIGDSLIVVAKGVATDLGFKSPLSPDTVLGTSAPFAGNPTDTVRIELTSLFRFWQFDTTQTTSLFLRLMSLKRNDSTATSPARTTGRTSSLEGATFTTLRFYSSRTAAFRPVIKLTYVPRIKLGIP